MFLFVVAGILVALDQITKTWIRSNLGMGETYCFIDSICEHVRFVHWFNTGVAFGMFQGNGTLFKITSTIIALAIIAFYSQIPEKDWLLRLALAFETGGAIGNLVDRYMIGHVTDFISVGNFAVFNIADACINIGVAFMLLSVLLEEIRLRKEKKLEAEIETEESAEEISVAAELDTNRD